METIKSSAEITNLFNQGKRLGTPDITLIVLRNGKQHDLSGRVAFIAGKKLGNAVWRNRAKRRMREVCQQVGGPFAGYDVIFLARKNVAISNYEKIVNNTKRALIKAGILESNRRPAC